MLNIDRTVAAEAIFNMELNGKLLFTVGNISKLSQSVCIETQQTYGKIGRPKQAYKLSYDD